VAAHLAWHLSRTTRIRGSLGRPIQNGVDAPDLHRSVQEDSPNHEGHEEACYAMS